MKCKLNYGFFFLRAWWILATGISCNLPIYLSANPPGGGNRWTKWTEPPVEGLTVAALPFFRPPPLFPLFDSLNWTRWPQFEGRVNTTFPIGLQLSGQSLPTKWFSTVKRKLKPERLGDPVPAVSFCEPAGLFGVNRRSQFSPKLVVDMNFSLIVQVPPGGLYVFV